MTLQIIFRLVVVAATCSMGALGYDCPTVRTPGMCMPSSEGAIRDLGDLIFQRMQNLSRTMEILNSTVSSQSLFVTAFTQTGDVGTTFNQLGLSREPHILGQAALTLEQCFYPYMEDIMVDEMGRKMMLQSETFAAQMAPGVETVARLVADFKNLTSIENRVSPGDLSTCSHVGINHCVEATYPTTKANGEKVTEEEDRLRKIVITTRSLQLYLHDLGRNIYWNSQPI